ncbi:MAG: Rne/Rng family ribonuclease, partial [Thermoanaerobaculia bacterium]
MTCRMLINARTPEELRIAIIDGTSLENYQVEVAERGLTRGNIYRGTIASIQPSLNAAFIDYGAERDGFLPIQDVVPDAYYRQPKQEGRPKIEEVLERRRPIIVQVVKEPEGSKGSALTTNLSLAGRYLVLTPFDEVQGVSRKVENEETRRRLKEQAKKLELPPGCGVIVRTNALDQNKTALNRDLNALMRLWKRVGNEARNGKGTKLIYSDQDLILRALRDHLDSSIEEVLTDDDRAHAKVQEYMRAFMPRSKTRLVRYTERAPLFSSFGLERQIERIYDRSVDLPGGGSIVIDATEALVAIDVNSGRTRGASHEETALNTNLEAAHEVARQLRLRDIGGLVVVDFIDMRSSKNQRQLEKALREAMKVDKARFTVGRISPNGLLEINRQRIQQALHLRTHKSCPTCRGTGRIPSPEMVGLNLLRRIESRATTRPTKKVRIALHPEMADALQNTRRQEIARLEEEFDLRVEVIASNRLHRPDQEIEWFD